MKKLITLLFMIFLFSTSLNAQEKYTNLWDKVEKLEIENLPKSALKIVEEIYSKAEKTNNTPQIVKTLFYKSKFSLLLEENAQLKVVNQFKEHINKSSFPTKNVLENILAHLYWQYFNQHRWQFYQRTKTAEKIDSVDFRTWDLNTLFKEIHMYYQRSLKETILLQNEDINQFAPILNLVKKSEDIRPTLYDFLAHNAFQFYKTTENNITKPIYTFSLDNTQFISDARNFSTLKFNTKDHLSLQFNALKIYQNLINFHLKNKNLTAFADVDLERLQFVKQHAVFKNKQELYLQTLKTSEKKYKKHLISGLYGFEIAYNYQQQANTFNPKTNSEHRFKNKEALTICNIIIKKFPKSKGAKKCENLKKSILNEHLSITSKKYIPIKKYSRLLINYKNIDRLFFTAYKISFKEQKKLQQIYTLKDKITFINTLEKTTTWNTKLRNEKDYLQHSTEIIVPEIAQGNYIITATVNNKLTTTETYGSTFLQVTNLALIESDFNGQNNFQVVNRNTGKPIQNARIHLKNEPNRRRQHPILDETLTTDKNGFAYFKPNKSYYNVIATVNYRDDSATFGNRYLYRHGNVDYDVEAKETRITPFIFTDRSIYRPGQKVYFKTIFIQKKGKKHVPFTNEHISVILEDPNGQEIKKFDLKLNEYGAASGEIKLPNNGLTGQYTFSFDESFEHDSKYYENEDYYFDYFNKSISVEEYKRPKFSIDFLPVTQSFKINDSVTITGLAKAFAGSNITDAKVVYRVHRKVQYPNWWYWRKPSFSSEAQEITHGESTTDASGNFSIHFLAQPDNSVSKESLPIFNYEITADITDVNGETRSATTTVKIGYHSLLATIFIDEKLDKENKKYRINIDTKNLNGEFVPATGVLKIFKLQAPKKPMRPRSWNAPDYQDISENEFRKLFPNEPYIENENNEFNWKKGSLVFEEEFNTAKAKDIDLKKIKHWVSGKYIAIVETTDTFNQKVKDQKRFSVFSTSEKEIADQKILVINTDKTSYKPNQNVKLQIGSASKDITVIVQIERKHKIEKTYLVHLNNETKTIKIPVTNKDVGGFAVKYHFVNYNHFKSGNLAINVPKQQNNIVIETKTFRDKLQPGQKETWSFTIKNDQKNKVTAEVLASMYDASLDEFKPHNWQFNPITYQAYNSYQTSNARQSFGNTYFQIRNKKHSYYSYPQTPYNSFNWFGFSFNANRRMMMRSKGIQTESIAISEEADEMELQKPLGYTKGDEDNLDEVIVIENQRKPINQKEKISLDGIQIRKNLQETAFFYPHLKTDKKGNITFSFTAPEALTRWKLQLLAHTKEVTYATKTLSTVTQKELMVIPNAPRFLREGDQITFSSKISNLSNKKLQGIAQLQLTNAITGKDINIVLNNKNSTKNFSVNSKGNTNVSWNLTIPKTIQAVQYKIVAKAGDFSDGEQNVLPVLTNRMLVTEALPMWVNSNQTKTFTLAKLQNKNSTTLSHHKLTLEVTSNPAWYAVQALPYLMEYPYECAEQTFAKYYANTLASFVANSNPKIQKVFNQWKSSKALGSNLEKNQELKSLIIQETPWLREAQSETEQKKRIALLFDLNKMKDEQIKSIHKLQDMQLPNGGFTWFKGGNYASTFITQHIATGFGHLKKLGVTKFDDSTEKTIDKAIQFLDEEIVKKYQDLLITANKIKVKKGQKEYTAFLAKNNLSYFAIQYLYMRSFYADKKINQKTATGIAYYKKQVTIYWNEYNLYAKGQIALIQYRNGEKSVANKILKSLKENSITSDELGMYWKENTAGYFYYQAPVETQALLIEAFSEIENNTKTIDSLKIWLLKNKQTNRWKTTKATTEAVYALLLNGTDWISLTQTVAINLGDVKIDPSKMKNVAVEVGTGYFKTSWNSQEITKKMAKVTINKKEKGIAWGGLYWQYFEDLDKITSAETPLKLKKKMFLKINTAMGKELQKIKPDTPLKVGDLITIRIELQADRNMEFIHMKDLRASGVEPVNVLSKYKWQDGLGYYENTKDAATNFFFDRLPKGVYVFEYDVRVNNVGNFSNGITTIQSMYAPEFSSHSKGTRIKVQ